MGDLFALAVEAHGGMQRRDELKTLRTELSVAGSMWSVEQQQSSCSRARSSRSRRIPNGLPSRLHKVRTSQSFRPRPTRA